MKIFLIMGILSTILGTIVGSIQRKLSRFTPKEQNIYGQYLTVTVLSITIGISSLIIYLYWYYLL